MLKSRIALSLLCCTSLLAFSQAQAAGSSSNTQPVAQATATSVNQVTIQNVVQTVSNGIGNSLSRTVSGGRLFNRIDKTSLLTGSSGVSSGEKGSGLAAWGSADYTYLRVVPDGDKAQRRTSDIYTLVGGADYEIADRIIAGVALSYSRAETDGRDFNTRPMDQSSDTYTVAPYLGWSPVENLSIDAMVGFSYSKIDSTFRTPTAQASADLDTRTSFFAVNAGYVIPLNQSWAIKPFAGFSFQHAETDAYRDTQNTDYSSSDNNHWVARAGARVMTALGSQTDGYVSAAYEREKRLLAIGESSARLAAGVASSISQGVELNVEANANVGRETQQEYGIGANLRFQF